MNFGIWFESLDNEVVVVVWGWVLDIVLVVFFEM